MKFKIDANFITVVDAATIKREAEVVSKELAARFIEAGLLEDDDIWYGTKFRECCTPCYVGDICRVLIDYLGVVSVTDDVYNACLDSVIFGDGDCPYCGGRLELKDVQGRTVYSWRNEFPPEFETESEIYCCNVCGERIIKTY